jgi:hypothetical protein
MFASVWVKDYTIELDGKPFVVKNERWLGIVNRKDGQPTGEEPYFSGSVYDWNEQKQKHELGGTVEKSKEEFDAEAERVCFFK